MSAFYDQASLVVVPSGYKTSKVYAQKPLTTDGQLTFSRASTATRVASNGLIEKVRTNLALQSQTFDNASWNKTTDGQVTITANAATAPDGTTTAEKMIPSAIAGFHCVAQTITLSAGEVTISVFAKAAENSFLQIFDSLTTDFANFNLTTGAVGSTDVYVASIQSAGNGWFRCTATKVVPSGSFVLRYGVVTTATAVRGQSFTGNGTDGLLIWGAQAEQGVATSYIATTSAAVSVGPVANVPRLDYLNSSCPRLLLEPQRTNNCLWSENFDNATWVKVGTTVTANNAVSPDGYTNADALVENTATNLHDTYQTFVSASSTAYTFSCYIKPSTRTRAYLRSDTSAGTARTLFDLTGSGSVVTLAHTSASISLVGNGWYRCGITFTEGTGAAGRLVFVEGAVGTNINYAGNGLTAFWLYGAQLEAGSYSTSYIPTLGSASTRASDACSKTGISSLIGQTEGTLFVDFVPTAEAVSTSTSVNGGSTASRVQIIYAGSTILSQVRVAGVTQFGPSVGGLVAGVRVKAALAYKANDFAFYVNGVQVGVGTTGTVPACSVFSFDSGSTGGALIASVNQALLFKTRLTNAQLAELTTL